MKTILAAIDLQQESGPLLARASQLATQHGAALVVQTVIELPETDALSPPEELERDIREALDGVLGAAGMDATPRVECGVPHQSIARAARELAADVVLIGPGRPATATERFFGSTADRLVRTSTVPVLVVADAAPQPYRRVAVAIDFSPLSEAALAAAQRLAPDASTELVHVVEIPQAFEQAMLRAHTPPRDVERYRQAKVEEARRQLLDFARPQALQERVSVLRGAPAAVLTNLSRSGRVDLVALGTQGRNAVAQALLGSVARRLLSGAGCDVLIVGDHGG